MEIGLENAIGTVHAAEGTGVKNGIITAGIVAGARALPDDSPFVNGDEEQGLGKPDGILGLVDQIVDGLSAFHRLGVQSCLFDDYLNLVLDFRIIEKTVKYEKAV